MESALVMSLADNGNNNYFKIDRIQKWFYFRVPPSELQEGGGGVFIMEQE